MPSVFKKLYHSLLNEKIRIQIKKNQYRLQGFFRRGDKVECNCCGKTYSSFLPFGNQSVRENARCPNCGSLERTRMLLWYLEHETRFFEPNIKVLHFAPEDGLKKIFKERKSASTYINGDIDPNLADMQMDITAIPFAENEFDYIICSHVLGHVPDEHKALTEMYRVLKPGGVAIILSLLNKKDLPTIENPEIKSPEERLRIYGERDLLRLHGNDFQQRIEKAGFKVEPLDYTKSLKAETVERFSMNNPERGMLFLSRKS